MAKSLDALGIDYVVDAKGVKHDWRKDITEALAKRQRPDGSFQQQRRQLDGSRRQPRHRLRADGVELLQAEIGRPRA